MYVIPGVQDGIIHLHGRLWETEKDCFVYFVSFPVSDNVNEIFRFESLHYSVKF